MRVPVRLPARSKPNPYCQLWIVLFRYGKGEDFQIHHGARGGLDIQGWDTKRQAEQVARNLRRYHGRGNVYVQKYGPYR